MLYETPYDWCPAVDLPDNNVIGVYTGGAVPARIDEDHLISDALESPIGSPRLREVVRPSDRVLIVSDDNTRATPVHKILPHVLVELAEAGLDEANVSLIIASGTHRIMSDAEKAAKLGEDVLEHHVVLDHRWDDPASLYHLGSAKGLDLEIWPNLALKQADFIIGIGLIIPHAVAGFSGGGKIITPGVCGERTNGDMHWAMVDVPPEQVCGVYDTPVRRIINKVAREVGLRFIVNVVLNSNERVVSCVAGDPVEAHLAGTRSCAEVHRVDLPCRADIVIVDSFGSDLDYWQAIKAMTPAGLVMDDGGIVIHVCDCPEGVSGAHPEVLEYGYLPVRKIDKSVAVHMVQASRVIADRGKGIIVTRGISDEDCRRLGFAPAADLGQAVAMALDEKGDDATIVVLKQASDIIPLVSDRQPAHSSR